MSAYQSPITVSSQGDVRIVEFAVNKILDEAVIREIGDGIGKLIDEKERPQVLLDFATVDHLSSAALGMLISVNGRIRERNGKLRLAAIKPQIKEVFAITKLDKLFKIKISRQEAVDSFQVE